MFGDKGWRSWAAYFGGSSQDGRKWLGSPLFISHEKAIYKGNYKANYKGNL